MSAVVTPPETLTREDPETPTRGLGWYGMVFFLASEAVFFANLIAAYLYLRVHVGTWPDPSAGPAELDKVLAGVNTIILLSSSFPMHFAARAISRGNQRTLRRGLFLTAILGTIFLSLQAFEYTHSNFSPGSGVFGSTFFTLTGFHGAHVTAGVLMILVMGFRSLKQDTFTKASHFPINAVEMYWHFVDVVWIILFTVLYLL